MTPAVPSVDRGSYVLHGDRASHAAGRHRRCPPSSSPHNCFSRGAAHRARSAFGSTPTKYTQGLCRVANCNVCITRHLATLWLLSQNMWYRVVKQRPPLNTCHSDQCVPAIIESFALCDSGCDAHKILKKKMFAPPETHECIHVLYVCRKSMYIHALNTVWNRETWTPCPPRSRQIHTKICNINL